MTSARAVRSRLSFPRSFGRGSVSRIEGTHLPAAGMAKKPEPSKPTNWNVYKIASKAVWLGEVEVADETAAMEKAAAEFKVPAKRLMA
jgi:hypothetical protein